MASRAKDLQLVLHVGLHKTGTTYLQNVLLAGRHHLMDGGVLFPLTGMPTDRPRTREGAQAGHQALAQGSAGTPLVGRLVGEVPDGVSTVLLSSELFSKRDPESYAHLMRKFGSVKVVLVVRRQDLWIESLYKQRVDQYADFEVRSFPDYLRETGAPLLDFHSRFAGWAEVVGRDNLQVLSYDDVGAKGVVERVLRLAGTEPGVLGESAWDVPRFESVRAIDTIGLRILNGFRLPDRDIRTEAARMIYDLAPEGDIALLTDEARKGIIEVCAPVNERIELEWMDSPAPRFRFGTDVGGETPQPPSASAMIEYVDQVLAVCHAARLRCPE